jgi:uncharacterized protein YbjT (DUF2867 family)
MILVTGAAGKTGRAIIRALAARGETVRALVRRPVDGLGAHELVVGDMRFYETFERAMARVQSVYFICPNMNPNEVQMGRFALKAARAAGVERFVYHSVLHPQTEGMPHHWKKLQVEELLLEFGLPFTILQPAAYMQNLLAHWPRILNEGVYPVPYGAEARLSLVDLEDVAQVAMLMLTQPNHTGATYELVGTEPLAQTAIASILGRELGRAVQVDEISLEQWSREARGQGLGEYQVETLVKMFRYYDRFGFEGNPNVLSWLLGRIPTSLTEFILRVERERLRN